MKMKYKYFFVFILFFSIFFIFTSDSFAIGVFDNVLQKYKDASATWVTTIQSHALRLFMFLATFSYIWTIGTLALKNPSLSDFLGETVRFFIFVGFFLWILQNSADYANKIIQSMRQIGGDASGFGTALSPSGIIDIGFEFFEKVSKGFSIANPSYTLLSGLMALLIFVILALVAINMLIQLCSMWILAYAGIFFLGFGGSRWTSDIAINYLKTVLSSGASLMTMTLLIGIGQVMITEAYKSIAVSPPNYGEIIIILTFSLTLLMLVDKVPSMVAGIITGASIGQSATSAVGGGQAYSAGRIAGKIASPLTVTPAAQIGKAALSGIGNKAFGNLTGGQGKGGTGGSQGGSGLSAMGINPKNSRPSS